MKTQSKRGRKGFQDSTKKKIAALKYYQSEKGSKVREKRKQINRLMGECKKYLEENPSKTVGDFLKEKENE